MPASDKLRRRNKPRLAFALFAATAFTLPAQTFTTLHSFHTADGSVPYAPLVQAIDGNFYGTTEFGGHYREGTVFKITPSGTLTKLYGFCTIHGCTDGSVPTGGLFRWRMGTSTGPPRWAGLTTLERSSKSPRLAR